MPPRSMPEDIFNSIQDESFWDSLQELVRQGGEVMPNVKTASRKTGNTGTLQQRIEERCELGQMGLALANVTGSALMNKGVVAPKNPPIQDGMSYCLNLLIKLTVTHFKKADPQLRKIPSLLRRVRHLLRVYYDFIIATTYHEDLKYCDFVKVFDVGITLHKVGLALQLEPSRLYAVMAAGGDDLEAFLLDEPLDIGIWRMQAVALEEQIRKDEEADTDDRVRASEVSDEAAKDLAAHLSVWLFADIAVAFVVNPATNQKEKRWAKKSLKRLVFWSTSDILRDALGDPLTDAMRPIYWSQDALVKFSKAGGLGALFGDWVNSACVDICADALRRLPDEAWQNQSRASLRSITREIAQKVSYESTDILKDSIMINALSNMFTYYGVAPFQAAAKRTTFRDPILFYFLAHTIKRDSLLMDSKAAWKSLINDYIRIPPSTERRYRWMNLSIADKWECITQFGCCNTECPEKRSLTRLSEKRVRGVRDAEAEARLDKFGLKCPACAACESVAYCTPDCQKAHWKTHKPECQKNRVKKNGAPRALVE